MGLFAVFGGQGVEWLAELRSIYSVYYDIRRVVETSISIVQEQAKHPSAASSFPHGFDVLNWIKEEDTSSSNLPNSEYLARAPLSYPMLGLISLLHYLIAVKLWNLEPQQIVKLFKYVLYKI